MNSLLLNVICVFAIANTNPNAERAQQSLDALYKNYAAPNTCLLHENYPSDQNNKATYLASEEQAKRHNEYSYLWPYSGTFSAVNALLESTGNKKYKKLLENKVLPGLEEYFDTRREPFAYSSYISNQPLSDRFYDDNVWLGIDFTDSYRMTKKQAYLEKAELIWEFILSGKDEVLGGGIYWCEQKKESKNTCSNAPGAVFALKLFQATQDSTYLKQGKELYEWTKKNLEDPTDHLYFDNIALNKKIGRAKFAYNSGQMMQAAALLYQITKQKNYLEEQNPVLACTCFLNGHKLLQELQQGHNFDIVVLCSQMEDMSSIEFMMELRKLEHKPLLMLFDEGRRKNSSALRMEDSGSCCCVERMELKNLLRELYRMPGQQWQRTEQQCQQLYHSWGIRIPDINCSYLTSAVGVVYGTSQKLAIRKEILQAVSEQYGVSVSAVDSGIRRMIDQLEAKPAEGWTQFKAESGFEAEKPTTGKLIYAIKRYLIQQKSRE